MTPKTSKSDGIISILAKEPSFALVMLYIVTWWTQLSERWAQRTGGVRIEAILVALLLVFVCLTLSSKRKEVKDKAGFTPYVILYFAVLLLQVVNSWDSTRSWFIFTERVLKYSLMALFISHFTDSTDKLKLIIFAYLFSCFKITQEGVLGGITGSLVWYNQGIPRLHGSTEMYGHPNSLSQLALGTLPFIYYLFPLMKKLWLKVSLLILLSFSIYCIIYTGSRTGYLGAICMASLVFWKASRKNKKRILLAFMILIPLLVMYTPNAYKHRFDSTFSENEAEGHSKEHRIRMYGEGWDIFLKNPLGVGIGNYVLANYKYNGYRQEVHCLYLEALTHIGIQGFIIFMLLIAKIFSVFKKLEKTFKELISRAKTRVDWTNQLDELKFLQATMRSLYVYFLLRLFVDIFGMDLYGICWWFTIGIASALTCLANRIMRQMNQLT